MSDNVLQTLQKLVQDVIAPDVRELKVRLESFQRETEARFTGVEARFTGVEMRFVGIEKQIVSLSKENEAQYKGILAAIAEMKAKSELSNMTEIAALRERVAILEVQRA